MMNCPLEKIENAQLLLDYGARNLEPELAAKLERHVAECGACRDFVRGQRAVREALDIWEAPPVSADFDSRLYRRIDARVSRWDLLLRPFREMTLWRGVPAMAAACALLVAGILLERPAIAPAPPVNDVAQADSVQPEQVERTLDAMEMLNEFSHHVRTDSPDSKL
jgi:hypothetical protein